MSWDSCPSCAADLRGDESRCPHCGSDLNEARETAAERQAGEAAHGHYQTGALSQAESTSSWERYEIPWLDVPAGFRAIREPKTFRLADRPATIGKYGMRGLILSGVALLMTLTPAFLMSLVPAALGVFWSLVALRLARKSDRTWAAMIGFALGGLACFSVLMTIVINVG